MNPIKNNNFGNMNLKSLYNACMNPSNAEGMLRGFVGNNPMLNMLLNKHDYKALFEAVCQSRGINPSEFINSLKTNLNG